MCFARAKLSGAKLSGAYLWEAMGLTDAQRAEYRSGGALFDLIPSTPLSRSTISLPASSTPQRDGKQRQSPTPAQVAETPLSASDTTLPMREENDADANSSGTVPPTQPNFPP